MGPLVSEAKMESYLRYQGIAVREGCEEVMRGKHLEKERRGYYVSPSIHLVKALNPKSIYQRDMIFGPNIAIYKIQDLDEVTQVLNQSPDGLVASCIPPRERPIRGFSVKWRWAYSTGTARQ
ncbi:MAG: aldehyde dehydrogenase family protein [Bdellovibrionota bacterium]